MTTAAKWTITATAVLGFGALRLPLERGLDLQRRAAGLRDDAVGALSLGDLSTQASLVAILGGLRSLVAALCDLRACDAWEKTNYAQVEQDYRFCQRLQPRLFYYWDRGQWMLAANAASHYRYNNPERGGLREVLAQSFVEKGLRMVKEGQRFLPDEYRIHEAEGALYRDKIRPRRALLEYRAWARAAACPNAPTRDRRFAAYALAHVPGREDEAQGDLDALLSTYRQNPRIKVPPTLLTLREIHRLAALADDWTKAADIHRQLRRIYDYTSVSRTPLLISTIQKLEHRLGLPPSECIPESVGPAEAGAP